MATDARTAPNAPSSKTASRGVDVSLWDAAGRSRGDATNEPKIRRERNAEESKRRILDCAEHEFAAKGFDGARLSAIAKAADVQPALIHHYFEDKEQLHHAVISRALNVMAEQLGPLLAVLNVSLTDARGARRKLPRAEVASITDAFVGALMNFFARHGAVIAILQHEASGQRQMLEQVVSQAMKPLFDAVADRISEMQQHGEARTTLDPRHLSLSVIAMVAFPFQEEAFVRALWPLNWRAEDVTDRRRQEIVDMVLTQLL
jgi:TetR/AcrR family transcriptional regulator